MAKIEELKNGGGKDGGSGASSAPAIGSTEANLDFVIKRRIQKWKRKAWMIPEFQVLPKPNILAKGRLIRVNPSKDDENIANTSSKKLKQVHEFLQ